MSSILAKGPGLSSAVAGEPALFSILPPASGKLNPPNVSVIVEGTSRPEIKFTNKKDGTVECSWTPKLPGPYKVRVSYDDKEIPGSPFACNVTGGTEAVKEAVSKVVLSGPALKSGNIHVTNEITIDSRNSGVMGGFNVSMEGPSKPEITFKSTSGGILILQYKPSVAGRYKLNVTFQGVPVPGSPFTINVQ